MNNLRRLLVIASLGLILFAVAQLISRNIYITASVELALAGSESDSLLHSKQTFISRIASLEAPGRLTEIGLKLGLVPMPLESFQLMELTE
jgi:hypothetical protein